MNQTYYLDRVVNKLVSETTIEGRIVTVPYSIHHATLPILPSFFIISSFSEFVIKVYGLTEEEVKYVWEQYRDIINNQF